MPVRLPPPKSVICLKWPTGRKSFPLPGRARSVAFPLADFNAIYGDLTTDEVAGRKSLQYSISEGLPALRQWIVDDLATSGQCAGLITS